MLARLKFPQSEWKLKKRLYSLRKQFYNFYLTLFDVISLLAFATAPRPLEKWAIPDSNFKHNWPFQTDLYAWLCTATDRRMISGKDVFLFLRLPLSFSFSFFLSTEGIRDLGKLYLIWPFDIRPEPIFALHLRPEKIQLTSKMNQNNNLT